MAFNWNRFAYTNFHELNLDWFNEHFKEIFEEWANLYDSMLSWKEDVDEEIQTLLTRSEQLLDVYEQWVSTTQQNTTDISNLQHAAILLSNRIDALKNNKLDRPTNNGSAGMVPILQSNNTTQWGLLPIDETLITNAVDEYLETHSLLNYVTPEMYGAVGNGIEDDTEAIQQCVVSGNNIYLKNTYRITDTLDFDDTENIVVFGGGTITRDADETFNTIDGQRCDNITIDNIIFNGNGNSSESSYSWRDNIQAAIILAGKSQRITVKNCKILNHYYGVHICGDDIAYNIVTFDNTAQMGTIANNEFYNVHNAVDTYGKAILIDHNEFYTTYDAIQIEPVDTMDLTEQNPLTDAKYYCSAYGVTISNNLIIDASDTAIMLHNNIGGITIASNTIINFKKGIQVARNARGVSVKGNILLNQNASTIDSNTRPWNYTPALWINGNGNAVDGNIFWDCDIAIYTGGGATFQNNEIYRPRISGYVQYQLSSYTDPTVIKNNAIKGHIRNASAWYGCRAIVFSQAVNAFLLDNTVDSDVQPVMVENSNVYVNNLYSNVQQTSAITTVSGIYKYSNAT